MPYSLDDPANLSPDQRRREVAAILARGILRLHPAGQVASESAAPEAADHPLEPPQKDLEVSRTSRPHVTGG